MLLKEQKIPKKPLSAKDYIILSLTGFFHCCAYTAAACLSDFVLPENLEMGLLSAAFLIGIASCAMFILYKARSVIHILLRIFVLFFSATSLSLLFSWYIEEKLGAFIPLKVFYDENFSSMAAISIYALLMLYTCVFGIAGYFAIKAIKAIILQIKAKRTKDNLPT